MELKHVHYGNGRFCRSLLIVPYGIETQQKITTEQREKDF